MINKLNELDLDIKRCEIVLKENNYLDIVIAIEELHDKYKNTIDSISNISRDVVWNYSKKDIENIQNYLKDYKDELILKEKQKNIYDKFTDLSKSLIFTIRKSDPHVTLICIVLVLISVVVVKALTSTGTPLKGGMPSGHSALAFAIATAITMLIERPIVSALAYIMAVLVAQSRIEGKIHTFWETVAGGLLGILVAMLVFQLKIINFY